MFDIIVIGLICTTLTILSVFVYTRILLDYHDENPKKRIKFMLYDIKSLKRQLEKMFEEGYVCLEFDDTTFISRTQFSNYFVRFRTTDKNILNFAKQQLEKYVLENLFTDEDFYENVICEGSHKNVICEGSYENRFINKNQTNQDSTTTDPTTTDPTTTDPTICSTNKDKAICSTNKDKATCSTNQDKTNRDIHLQTILFNLINDKPIDSSDKVFEKWFEENKIKCSSLNCFVDVNVKIGDKIKITILKCNNTLFTQKPIFNFVDVDVAELKLPDFDLKFNSLIVKPGIYEICSEYDKIYQVKQTNLEKNDKVIIITPTISPVMSPKTVISNNLPEIFEDNDLHEKQLSKKYFFKSDNENFVCGYCNLKTIDEIKKLF